MECISLIKEILTFKWGHALAILKSWMWIMGHLRLLMKRRNFLTNNNIITPDFIFKKSIVKKYFIERKKKYTQIKN
jgi:hypothetical protein|tara:strand:- start:408 stop:635 length:228 start_codon:yes stop_codon:yes gene_type:complete